MTTQIYDNKVSLDHNEFMVNISLQLDLAAFG